MKEAILRTKLKAYLHDPLHKTLMLMQTSERHEDVANELADIVGVSLSDIEEIKLADQLASSADRFVFPGEREYYVKFLDAPIISHPFSGGKLDLKDELGVTAKDEVIHDALNAIKRTLERYAQWLQNREKPSEKVELLYWLLWRRFNYDVQKEIGHEAIRSVWPFLPADTRIPDHSLWNHLKITAAISACISQMGSESKSKWIDASFLLFSIGPVQSFIGTARKTLDHWMGSFLLSYLTFLSMKAIFEEIGADAIVFPELLNQPLLDYFLATRFKKEFEDLKPRSTELLTPSLPNRFLAIVPTGIAEELAKKAETEVKAEWERIWKAGKSYFEDKVGIVPTAYWNHLWDRQCMDYFEIYWLVLPWKRSFQEQREEYLKWIDSESPAESELPATLRKLDQFYTLKSKEYISDLALAYPLIYELAEHLFGARKNWRYFQPSLQNGEPSFKCNLCGVREVLHTGKPKIPGYYEPFAEVLGESRDNSEYFIGKDGWREIQRFWREEILNKADQEEYSGAKLRKFFKTNERLCAPCATKRVAQFYFLEKFPVKELDFNYPSTAEVAGLFFKKRILESREIQNDPHLLQGIVSNVKKLKGESFQTYAIPRLLNLADGQPILSDFAKIDSGFLMNILKESTYDEIYEEIEAEENRAVKNEIRKQLLSLLRKINVGREISSYYCYLAMDGDKMGKWVAGKFLPQFEKVIHPDIVSKIRIAEGESDRNVNENIRRIARILEQSRQVTPSIHSMLSSVQNQFSLKIARDVVEEKHWGKLIYSGGDDVLAFAPVAEGIKIAHDLRLAFSGFQATIGEGDGWVLDKASGLKLAFGDRATASIGLVIAHHTMPMRLAIERAREMEKRAKELSRDSIGIAILKRSGEIVETVLPFRAAGDNMKQNVDVIKDVVMPLYDWISGGDISRGFVYALKAQERGFSDHHWEMFEIEMKRLFQRKIKKRTGRSELLKSFDIWCKDLSFLFLELRKRMKNRGDAKDNNNNGEKNSVLNQILNLFSVVEFMARES
jgi:CRISPR-associated protein Cmr2